MEANNNDSHLSDKEIIEYANYSDKLSQDVVKRIEKHLYIVKCQTCLERFNEVCSLNKTLRNTEKKNELVNICSWSDKVDLFVSGDMDESEKNRFIKHMSECDECRKTAAVLMSLEDDTESAGNTQKKLTYIWEAAKDGILVLNQVLHLGTDKFSRAFISPVPPVKVRSMAVEENRSIRIAELNLPDDSGNIKLTCSNPASHFRLIIETAGVKKYLTAIDIYNNNGILIDGADHVIAHECYLNKGEYKVRINDKFEIPVSLK